MGVVKNALELNRVLPKVRMAFDEAMDEWLPGVMAEQKTRVPVITGNLRDSIEVRKTPKARKLYIDLKEAPYAPYVEFGTRKRKAKPFFYAPITERGQDLRRTLFEKINEALRTK